MKLALFARLEAKPGKEQDVAEFLRQGLALANQEATTLLWFALRLGPTTFAIFDAFGDEAARQASLEWPDCAGPHGAGARALCGASGDRAAGSSGRQAAGVETFEILCGVGRVHRLVE